jgi:PIN domain nuclease of toxin-antitoxin system
LSLLIDTHIAVWAVEDDERLPLAARELLLSGQEIFVSAVSIWEIAIKFSLRRARRHEMTFSGYHAVERFEEAGFELLPIEPLHAAAVGALPHIHNDPFDRLMICHALVENMTFLTHDRELAGYGDHVLVV